MDDIDRMVGKLADALENMIRDDVVVPGTLLDRILHGHADDPGAEMLDYTRGLLEVPEEVADLVLERLSTTIDFTAPVAQDIERL